jgi:hypothetical protein
MSKLKNKICLYANCIPVKGATRSLICDLQRNSIYQIPNYICDILQNNKGCTQQEMLDSSPVSLHEDIKEYLQIMLENEIIFYTDSPQFFPEMSTQWDEPFEISNAIIDIDSSSVFATEAIRQLLVSGCRALQIRVYSTMGRRINNLPVCILAKIPCPTLLITKSP